MPRSCYRAPGLLFAALLTFLSLEGCKDRSSFQAPVTQFRDSSSVVIEATKAYLVALNKSERDHYIFLQASTPAQIQLLKINQVQVFNAEEIGVRLRALDQLADYTDLLYQLATSKGADVSAARAKDLGSSLDVLSGEVAKLTNGNNERFKSSASGAFALIGEVLRIVIDRKLAEALQKAIAAGDKPVNELILAIEGDAQVAYERKRQALSERRRIAVDDYNTEFEKGVSANRAKLTDLAGFISKTEDRWEIFQTSRPLDGLEQMRAANSAMVKYATNPKPTITDLTSFVNAIEIFASTAKRVGAAAQQIFPLSDTSHP